MVWLEQTSFSIKLGAESGSRQSPRPKGTGNSIDLDDKKQSTAGIIEEEDEEDEDDDDRSGGGGGGGGMRGDLARSSTSHTKNKQSFAFKDMFKGDNDGSDDQSDDGGHSRDDSDFFAITAFYGIDPEDDDVMFFCFFWFAFLFSAGEMLSVV